MRAKRDVPRCAFSAVNCCPCSSSLRITGQSPVSSDNSAHALNPAQGLNVSVGYKRLLKAYDSKAASAARELEADVKSILAVIHNIVKSSFHKMYARKENTVMFLLEYCHQVDEKVPRRTSFASVLNSLPNTSSQQHSYRAVKI